MPHVEVIAKVPVKADALWREIGSFQGVAAWHPMLERVEGNGEQPGAIRIPESKDGHKQTERLREISPVRHFMRYDIVSSPMPIKNYVAELCVADNGDGSSTVVWGGDFQVTSADEGKTVEKIQEFLSVGLESLQKKYR